MLGSQGRFLADLLDFLRSERNVAIMASANGSGVPVNARSTAHVIPLTQA
jgi:hypothetical protein